MRIDYDKVSGALYIKIREGEYSHTEDFSENADIYLDVDGEGNVLGLEALSFEDLAQAAGERGGKLEIPDRWTVTDHPSQTAILLSAVATLPPKKREVLRLHYYEGLTKSEIAKQQGVSVGQVGSLIRSALQDLKEALKPEFAGEEDEASLKEALTLIAS